VPFCNEPSLNLVRDQLSSRLIFECCVPHVYLPDYRVGAQLTISKPEMAAFVKVRRAIGDYLWHLYANNPLHVKYAISESDTKTWVILGYHQCPVTAERAYVPIHLTTSLHRKEALHWQRDPSRHLMLEAYDVARYAIFEDFYLSPPTA